MKNLKNKLKIYIKQNLNKDYHKEGGLSKLKNMLFITDDQNYEELKTSYETPNPSKKNTLNIKAFLNNHKQYNDFQTMLFKLIDVRNLKDSEVYNKVNIDRRLFSKIRSDKNYHPSKETIILLAVALELTEDELDKLLDSASYSLPKNNKYDLIIRFCFINNIFKVSDINELLYEYNCKLLNY